MMKKIKIAALWIFILFDCAGVYSHMRESAIPGSNLIFALENNGAIYRSVLAGNTCLERANTAISVSIYLDAQKENNDKRVSRECRKCVDKYAILLEHISSYRGSLGKRDDPIEIQKIKILMFVMETCRTCQSNSIYVLKNNTCK